ncbi:HD domain-containing protein [Ferrimonas marina]|uniref:HD domain-containing protein n=1 Tax=Ferrimonas marina TaxID=299255 RepID=A0A1M5RL64_9GAMM|nr:HD domain-containing protein [Ferrimonas marina]SHH26818.1 hypothetical protein SAMN02745129_1660 [Ferrimonas marina]
MRQGKSINTLTAGRFWPLDPRQEEIQAQDIAHSLSMLCRANGHYRHFFSVAQHSLYCADEARARGLSRRVQLACLLHDASEAYTGDLTRPIKASMPAFEQMEAPLQQCIYATYGLADLTAEELAQVGAIDDAMLGYEMAQLLNHHELITEPLQQDYDLSFRMMDQVRDAFLARLQQLLPSP